MTRKGKTSEKGRGAGLLVAAVALLATLLASCDNLITRTPPADIGGGTRSRQIPRAAAH